MEKKKILICIDCGKEIDPSDPCDCYSVWGDNDDPVCHDCEQKRIFEQELYPCPHCKKGEYQKYKGAKYCFYCQQSLDIYGSLP